MDVLLNAIRTVAREDQEAIASFSGEIPVLSAVARARVAERILSSRPPRPMARRRFVPWAGAAVVLAAAGWALVVWKRPYPGSIGDGDVALPAYAVSASGGVAEVRGPAARASVSEGRTAAVQRLRSDSELQVTCRPDTAVAGPVAVRAFFVQAERAEEVSPELQIAPSGAVALRLRGADLLARYAGHGELRIWIGRPPLVIAAPAAATGQDGDGARWLIVPLDLVR